MNDCARSNHRLVMSRRFGALCAGIHRSLDAMNNVIVEAVFDVRRAVLGVKEPAVVGFVFREEQLGRALTMEPASAVIMMIES